MGRRNDHTREEIKNMAILAAEEVLITEGYTALTTRRVAKDIGYTVGSLYMVFRNMDELMLTINARTLNKLYDLITLNLAKLNNPEPTPILYEIARSYVEFAEKNTERWQAVFMHRVSDKELLDDEYFAHINRLFILIGEQLCRLNSDLSEIEIETLARALWGSVHGMVHLGLDKKLNMGTRFEKSSYEVVQLLVSTTLKGLNVK